MKMEISLNRDRQNFNNMGRTLHRVRYAPEIEYTLLDDEVIQRVPPERQRSIAEAEGLHAPCKRERGRAPLEYAHED